MTEIHYADPKYSALADKVGDVASPPADAFPEPDYDGDPDLAERMIADGMLCQGEWPDEAEEADFRGRLGGRRQEALVDPASPDAAAKRRCTSQTPTGAGTPHIGRAKPRCQHPAINGPAEVANEIRTSSELIVVAHQRAPRRFKIRGPITLDDHHTARS